MSLIRRVWLLLAGVMLFASAVGVGGHAWVARQAAVAQLQARNDDGAMLLALALSQQAGDVQRMQRVALALSDTGQYRRLRLLAANGEPWFERDGVEHSSDTPQWLARWFAVDVRPGVESVSNGGQPLGSVELSAQTSPVADAWWDDCLALAGWLALLGVAALAASWGLLRSWQRPLDAVLAQAQALDEQRYILASESKVPELRRLTRSMNNTVQRLQAVYAGHATQVEALRERAHIDPVTGLANRRQLVGQLNAALFNGHQGGAGLLIVRLLDLAGMNRRIGHASTDRLLAALGEVLQAYPRRVAGALTGRLNGSDFALFLPANGTAGETARSLVDALRAALATVDPGAELVVGGVDGLDVSCGSDALAIADVALARAEELGGFAIELSGCGTAAQSAVVGEQEWHRRLTQALAAGRSRLAEFPLLDATGRLVHLECAMRLKLGDAEGFQPAAHWLAMALRCRLGPQVDLAGLSLALAATSRDGLPRCVNMSVASLASAGFVSAVAERLAAAPRHAARLSIDLRVGAALRHGARLRQASAQWRRLGVKLGLEHAGANVADMPLLQSLGIDYIKIDAAYVRDVARDPQVREFARGLASLLRGMGIQVLAEGVASAEDLAVLWQLGLDGATGPAVRLDLKSNRRPEAAHDSAPA